MTRDQKIAALVADMDTWDTQVLRECAQYYRQEKLSKMSDEEIDSDYDDCFPEQVTI